MFRPIHERTDGVDGWVSLEVSPLLAHDTDRTLASARSLHQRCGKPNLLIKIPGTKEGLSAIEAAIFAGIPINVTLLFSPAQYMAAAEAYLRGVERRIEAGIEPGRRFGCLAVRQPLGRGGRRQSAARAQRTGSASQWRNAPTRPIEQLLASARFQRAANSGARAQRLLWASTGSQGPRSLRRPLCESARRSVHGQHHAGRHAQCLRRSRRCRRHARRRMAATAIACWRALPRRASTSRRWPPGCRTMARRHSSKSWNDLMGCIDGKASAIRKAS